jgi:hypothetical protein
MIDPKQSSALFPAPAARAEAAQAHSKVLKMRYQSGDDARMAGAIPVWEERSTAQEKIEENLAGAAGQAPGDPAAGTSFATALAEAGNAAPAESEEFGFGDLIDMVNPLQHIPIVNTIYRNLTGDTIKPVSQIIGGGLFGGIAGAGAGIANTIVENETGKDITGNVMAFVIEGRSPHFKSTPDRPEQRLNAAVEQAKNDAVANPNANPEAAAAQNLPPSLLAYADMGVARPAAAAATTPVVVASVHRTDWDHLNS